MPRIKIPWFKTLIDCKCKIFYRGIWNEKADEWYSLSKTELLERNPGSVCKNKRINVYGLS